MVKMHFYTFLLSAMVICLSNLGEVEGRVPPAVRVGKFPKYVHSFNQITEIMLVSFTIFTFFK